MGTPKRNPSTGRTRSKSKPKPKVKVGRPPIYRPEFVEQVEKLCAIGLTDYEVSEFFKVTVPTLWRWKAQFPEFCKAMVTGKEACDERVVASTYHRAVGYTFKSEKVFQHKGEIIRAETVEHVPPDVTAASLWLRNRQPDKWRNREADQTVNVTVTLAELVNLSYRPDLPELPAAQTIDHETENK
jgi:hypothetical protein